MYNFSHNFEEWAEIAKHTLSHLENQKQLSNLTAEIIDNNLDQLTTFVLTTTIIQFQFWKA